MIMDTAVKTHAVSIAQYYGTYKVFVIKNGMDLLTNF